VRLYDCHEPLIVIHIPKAAGNSSQRFFRNWYGDAFLRHYFDESTGEMPPRYDLYQIHTPYRPIVLHGHFNKARSFGVEDYYPEVKQFITILRDPYELTVSRYFYLKQASSGWKDQSHLPKQDIETYLSQVKPNMLNHFPRAVSRDNYKEIIETYFIEIGITEHLRTSLRWIACKLGMSYDDTLLGHYNTTTRDQTIPSHIKDLFMEKNQLEFEVYNYALEKFIQQGAPPDQKYDP
jgi:hypothetical protein